MFCEKCGAQNPDGVKFCQSCGAEMKPADVFASTPSYTAQSYGTPTPATGVVPGKGLGIASMVVGIISLALFCIWFIAIPCAIVGAVLGGVAYNKAKQAGTKNKMANAGIVCSAIALAITILFTIIVTACICAGASSYPYYY